MNRRFTFRVSVLLGIGLLGYVHASDFRSPLICERGPLRYVFEEWDSHDYGLKIWAEGYGREAHKAFMNHGFKAKPLTNLFFNKSDFRLTEAFPESLVKLTSENYNPFVRVVSISPRASYIEKGVAVGARFAYPVYKDKGRIGLRANVPFRYIKVEKDDTEGRNDAQLKDLAFSGDAASYIFDNEGNYFTNAEGKYVNARHAFAVRWDFMEAMIQNANGDSFINYKGEAGVELGGKVAMNTRNDASPAMAAQQGGLVYSPEGHVPTVAAERVTFPYKSTLKKMPVNGLIPRGWQNTYGFDWPPKGEAGLYVNWADQNATSVAARLDMQAKKAQLWFVSANDPSAAKEEGGLSTEAQAVHDALFDNYFNNYRSNSYEWMADQGFAFDSTKRTGIGDIDLDLFYEHQLAADVMGEVFIGVRFPTGGSEKQYSNPYLPNMGNSEHWEIKLGGLVAWQPLDWMNIKFDARYAFVLKGKEQRCAAFKGAQIKNIGPKADVDIDWGYFDGALDFNFFHPKTDAISLLIGYDFYYKTKDHVSFKNATMASWMGNELNTTTGNYDAALYSLDNGLLAKNTEAIAHKARFEASFRISRFFELYGGGTYTFAGQNIPRETDCHGGVVVTF